ncbi:unnamed protein product [Paramecium sonneborni]|uniref:Transmembrane protein n=1 Tax=Paramecium sonneborni TaxID=65129 RepID=A0A8S1L091_9CILI|nr:unnamed protein product [Paramecium sonneborni]
MVFWQIQKIHRIIQRILIIILNSLILITFVLLLQWVLDFRYFCYSILKDFRVQILEAIFRGIIEQQFVLIGFNIFLYDILVRYLIQHFWFTLFVVSLAKFLAKRYFIRNYVQMAIIEKIDYFIYYLANEKKPVKFMCLIQFLTIPTIFKTRLVDFLKQLIVNSYILQYLVLLFGLHFCYIQNKIQNHCLIYFNQVIPIIMFHIAQNFECILFYDSQFIILLNQPNQYKK